MGPLRRHLAACLPLLLGAGAAAMDSAFDLAMRPGVLPAGLTLRLDAQAVEAGAAPLPGPFPRGSAGDVGDHDLRLSGRARLWGSASSALFISGGAGRRWLDGDAWRPSLAGPLPETLDDLAVGVGGEMLLGRWQLIGQVGLRSRSDAIFSDEESADLQAEAWAHWQGAGAHGALFGLSWGFRDRLLAGGPLPVAAWLWQPAPQHRLTIGLPILGYDGNFGHGWAARVLILPFRQDAQLSWRPWHERSDWANGLRLTALLGGEAWRYDLEDQQDPDDELRYRDRRAGLRLGWGGPFWEALAIEGGWAFNRTLEEGPGRTLFSGDLDDAGVARLEIDDGLYGRALLSWRF